jgi:hypothetical protein
VRALLRRIPLWPTPERQPDRITDYDHNDSPSRPYHCAERSTRRSASPLNDNSPTDYDDLEHDDHDYDTKAPHAPLTDPRFSWDRRVPFRA